MNRPQSHKRSASVSLSIRLRQRNTPLEDLGVGVLFATHKLWIVYAAFVNKAIIVHDFGSLLMYTCDVKRKSVLLKPRSGGFGTTLLTFVFLTWFHCKLYNLESCVLCFYISVQIIPSCSHKMVSTVIFVPFSFLTEMSYWQDTILVLCFLYSVQWIGMWEWIYRGTCYRIGRAETGLRFYEWYLKKTSANPCP